MSDPNEDPNARYDRVRCRTCGVPWRPYTDEHGRIHAGHLPGLSCSRNRPVMPDDTPETIASFGQVEAVLMPYVQVMGPVHSNGKG